jgi:hypothetical protein
MCYFFRTKTWGAEMNKTSHIVGPIKDKYFVRVEIEWVKPYKRPAWISAVADIFLGVPATSGSAFVERIVSDGPHASFFTAQQKAEADAQKKIARLS